MEFSNGMEDVFDGDNEMMKEFENRCNDILNDPMQLKDDSIWENCPDAKAKFYYGIFYEYIHKVSVDTQVILQLLIAKGFATQEEVDSMREKVKKLPKYKEIENESLSLKRDAAMAVISYKAMYDMINDKLK